MNKTLSNTKISNFMSKASTLLLALCSMFFAISHAHEHNNNLDSGSEAAEFTQLKRVDDATVSLAEKQAQAVVKPSVSIKPTVKLSPTKPDIKNVKLIWGDTVYGFAKAQWPVAYCIQEMNKLDSEFRIYEGRRLKVPNMVRGQKLDLSLYCPDYAAGRKTKVVKARVTVSDYIKKAEVAHKKREAELAEQARLADLANKQSKIEAAAAKTEAQRLANLLAEKEAVEKAAKIKAAEEKEAQLAREAGAKQLAAEQAAAQQLASITFKLDSSLTLKENLEDWMERAQGQLIWHAKSDVEVTLDRLIANDLVEALEYISVRLHDYKLQFFAKNTTLVVTEK